MVTVTESWGWRFRNQKMWRVITPVSEWGRGERERGKKEIATTVGMVYIPISIHILI